jgi:hypothetical protein
MKRDYFVNENITNFLENIGVEEQEKEMIRKKSLVKNIKPMHNYTIYNSQEGINTVYPVEKSNKNFQNVYQSETKIP